MKDDLIQIIDESGDDKMLWETIGKPAYEKGLLEGRNESGLYAIVPMSVLERKDLSANAKLLYAEIMALSKKSGKCYATNEYLADMLGLSKRSIPILLKELRGTGLLMVNIKRSKKGTYRDILVSFFSEGGYQSMTMGGIAKQRGQKRNRQIEINKESKSSNEQVVADSITPIFKVFEEKNPSIKRMYGNKTQRASAENLVSQFGIDKVLLAAKFSIKVLGMAYAPRITTPYELEKSWAKLVAFSQEQRSKLNSKGKIIIE